MFAGLMLLLLSLVLLINSISSMKLKNVFNDMPFECGISSNLSSRKPYSMPFFFYMLIFLLFDMKVILIFPFSFFTHTLKFMKFYLMIMIILVLSLIFEGGMGSLKW
uniref:NADH-ubiquinone oxidoreductase chain 3 n=1 Tax=Liposcelis entomophila TaxID=550478 RepID=A0A096X707_9NEOP|nr:NADH dehydrogenase subunit 3 [Liposcelis entomophila]AHA47075.1 NADH dehydrogenase subunit 3 [Liposcelis entomophila]